MIVVVGSANADVVVEAPRRPGPGETVLGGDTTVGPGGKGANTAVAAGRLGAEVSMLGALGRDANGDLLASSLAGSGVDTALLRRVDRPTGAAYITVTPDGENSILVSPGANEEVDLASVQAAEAVIASAGVLVASLEVPVPSVCRAVALAGRAGTRCVLNASPVAELPAETLGALDPLVVNEHEAGWLLGEPGSEPEGLASGLLGLGPRSVVVTLGARGAIVAEPSGQIEVPAEKVRAVDTTGAGDAFAGALAARLASGASLADAARYAVRVAAISVTRHGAQASYPSAAEVDSRLSRG